MEANLYEEGVGRVDVPVRVDRGGGQRDVSIQEEVNWRSMRVIGRG